MGVTFATFHIEGTLPDLTFKKTIRDSCFFRPRIQHSAYIQQHVAFTTERLTFTLKNRFYHTFTKYERIDSIILNKVFAC